MRTKIEYTTTTFERDGRSESFAFLASLGKLSCPGHSPSSAIQGLAALVAIERDGVSFDPSRLRSFMTARGWTVADLAALAGIDTATAEDALGGIADPFPILKKLRGDG